MVGKAAEMRDTINEGVEAFANDWLKANPKK